MPGVDDCGETGSSVFGAMLGAAFAAQGVSQVANCIEAVTAARTVCATALVPIQRTLGAPEQEIVIASDEDLSKEIAKKKKEQKKKKQAAVAKRRRRSSSKGARKSVTFDNEEEEDDDESYDSLESGTTKTHTLPKYLIDSSSHRGLKPAKITGTVRFRDVSFAYPTRPDNPVFHNFNLEIKAGTTVALVGPSGGGKSTTVGLVERFYDPQHGTISLNGIDLKLINVHYLRSVIGYVGQEPTLFATTIAGNIRYGKPTATMDEVREAAILANAHDFIMSLPDGYDTQVGDKGNQLSGGQKQRIASKSKWRFTILLCMTCMPNNKGGFHPMGVLTKCLPSPSMTCTFTSRPSTHCKSQGSNP